MTDGLSLIEVSKTYNHTLVLSSVTFDVREREIVALLGPSGCGKSTTLALIAGLEHADSGEILWNEESLRGIPPYERGFGLMFQDLALFPHLNVFENVAFGLRQQKLNKEMIRHQVKETLALVNLPGYERRDVSTLSGGEQQRVALARSLAPRPRLLMLDEPLASLDRTLKERLVVELREILTKMNQTAIYVTHDQEEAFMIADRVVVMRKGQVEQIGTPQEVYANPQNPFIAQFLGMNNLLKGQIVVHNQQYWLNLPIGKIRVTDQESKAVIALIRPQAARLSRGEGLVVQAKVLKRMFRGDHCQMEVDVQGQRLSFNFSFGGDLPSQNEEITLTIDPQEIQIFPA